MIDTGDVMAKGCTVTPDILLIEGCDFEGHPAGGQLAFARQLLSAFGDRFALVGVSTDSTPVGRWVERNIDGTLYRFLAVSRADKDATGQPLIPLRIRHYLALRKNMNIIRDSGIRNVFTQCAQALLAIRKFEWESVCYCFPSVKNEVEHSRYRWARLVKRPYERALFKALTSVDTILAAADASAIDKMVQRSNGVLGRSDIIPCPTRADGSVFFEQDRHAARTSLGLDQEAKILLSCGKLTRIKGWRLLLQAVQVLKQERPNVQLIFVGDGEERDTLVETARHRGLADHIRLVGVVPPEKVALYMNAADLLVVGSHQEGWSVAMVEAVTCGLPIVSTDVSGAKDLIREGLNGFVLENRDPVHYAKAIGRALHLEDAKTHSLDIATGYSLATLSRDLSKAWSVLAD